MINHTMFSTEAARMLQTCVHCGLCLASCPTYMIDGREADSPRGRLVLMASIDRHSWDDPRDHFRHIDNCLGCLACETACPSGVPYGDLLEQVRAYQREQVSPLNFSQRLALAWTTTPRLLNWLTALLRWLQRLRLDHLILALRLLPRALRLQLAGLPILPIRAFSRQRLQRYDAAHPDGLERGTVALFTGCVMDSWFADVHAATVRVLRWNGFTVVLPEGQTCCGALHAHSGANDIGAARRAANRAIFNASGAKTMLVNAAGCGAHLRHNDESHPESTVYDVTEWLTRHELVQPAQKLPSRIVYDAPCHLFHAQGVQSDPVHLLQRVCEDFAPLAEAEVCCGSAGLYSLARPDMSQQLLRRKLEHIAAAGPDMLVTANPGCQMQLQGGLRMLGNRLPVRHVMEVLDEAYQQDGAYRTAVVEG